MLQQVNDLRVKGEGLSFETRLPKSFLALLVSSLKEYGVEVKSICDKGDMHEVVTSHGTVELKGSFSVSDVKTALRHEVYVNLNKRFDERVALLMSKGFKYYRAHVCFAKSCKGAACGNCIPNATIMHADDFMFLTSVEQL